MPRPKYVHVDLKQGKPVYAFATTGALYDAMHRRGTGYIVVPVTKECTMPMLKMAISRIANEPDCTFYYVELRKPIEHPTYGTVAAWGYWEYGVG